MKNSLIYKIPLRHEFIFIVLIFAVAAGLRFYNLSADPPNGITFSQGIETDPPQYTIFARDAVLTGDWNSYRDNAHLTYQYSLISGLSYLVFKFAGPGTYQANLVAVLLSMMSLLVFYFLMRKIFGNGTALLAAFFFAINYLGIFWGRRPFLENGLNFFCVCALFCLACGERRIIGHILFGVFAAAAIFFGKIIGLAFLAAPAAYYLIKIFYLRSRGGAMQMIAMMGGFAAVTAIWYFMIFEPHSRAISGYVGEQAFGLYGSPEGLSSPSKFIWKLLTFGKDADFFDRMPVIGVLSGAAIILITGRFFGHQPARKEENASNLLPATIAFWLIGTFLAQMPWNYQPVRYQTAMIFPMAALAGVFLAYWINLREKFTIQNKSIAFNLISFPVVMVVVYQLMGALTVSMGYQFIFARYIWPVTIMVLVLFTVYNFISWRAAFKISVPPIIRYSAAAAVVFLAGTVHASRYIEWAAAPLFTTRAASQDLAGVLSPGTVISGPFGPALAMDNELGCIIHIFGTSRPDSALFERFPITHLIMERSNVAEAEDLYPELMKNARLVCHYYLNCRKITIYRIAGLTGNRQASEYLPSNFEKAVDFYNFGMVDKGEEYIARQLKLYPDNYITNLQAGFNEYKKENYDSAVVLFKKAATISPTDFYVHYWLSEAYIAKAEATGEQEWKSLGNSALQQALVYNPRFLESGDYETGKTLKDSTDGP